MTLIMSIIYCLGESPTPETCYSCCGTDKERAFIAEFFYSLENSPIPETCLCLHLVYTRPPRPGGGTMCRSQSGTGGLVGPATQCHHCHIYISHRRHTSHTLKCHPLESSSPFPVLVNIKHL